MRPLEKGGLFSMAVKNRKLEGQSRLDQRMSQFWNREDNGNGYLPYSIWKWLGKISVWNTLNTKLFF